MKSRTFKVGDRVCCVAPFGGRFVLSGKVGTVVAISNASVNPIGVGFDEPFSAGHTCFKRCQYGHGRWGGASELELITADEIDIQISFEEIFDDG